MERKWEIVEINGEAVILPKFPLLCPFCSEEMILHDFSCYKQANNFYHVDIHMKCPKCNFWCVFGVPISEEEFEKLRKSKYHRKILRWEIAEIYGKEILEKIGKKLEKLGYW